MEMIANILCACDNDILEITAVVDASLYISWSSGRHAGLPFPKLFSDNRALSDITPFRPTALFNEPFILLPSDSNTLSILHPPDSDQMGPTSAMDSLPNEILNDILDLLPTRALLPLVRVNSHFYSVALHILHQRLLQAAALPEHRLILECYHPSAKLSTPYLYCDYLRTDKIGAGPNGDEEANGPEPEPTLAGLKGLYSHFRPVVQEENRRPRLRYPRRQQQQANNGEPSTNAADHRPSEEVFLDEGELFSQLCCTTNLVKVGPKPGFFLSNVNVSDGIMRVWRSWLSDQTKSTLSSVASSASSSTTDLHANAKRSAQREATREKATESPEERLARLAEAKAARTVLWADPERNVGVRFRVTKKATDDYINNRHYRREQPLLVPADEAFDEEEQPVAYQLEFDEVLVRSSRLLFTMQKSEEVSEGAGGNHEAVFMDPTGPVSIPVQMIFWPSMLIGGDSNTFHWNHMSALEMTGRA
ncbi:uncharacterized protein B0T23DRAFT_415764 [Neurospora hispaniola]|uniref:F-box domain-containing protein n=1 Tax=Neurospora hispaniola TaxID=588809 RepID=A0AAJ0I094_9PEZI|nr:hypothetical protein B0T23DRAFT_415764 [Neurospora hispaniola]